MRIGTHHFKSIERAYDYYWRMGVSHADVREKLAADEIAIGPPLIVQVTQAATVGLDADGRYYIEESPHHERRPQPQAKASDANPQGAPRTTLVVRGIKAAGGYLPPKGFKVVGYSYSGPSTTASLVSMRRGYKIYAQVSRDGAHHLTGRVYERVIAKGSTFEQALDNAVTKVKQQRAKA